jgi:lactose/L-arabinose transport system substrate-binding protein
MQQNGGGIFSADGRIILDSPQNREALAVIRRMLDAGICAAITAYSPAMLASYSEDSVATYVAAVWGMKPIKKAAESTAGRWGVFRLPAFREGGLRTSNLGGSVLVIPGQSPVVEHAWKFLEFANCTVESQVQQFREFGLFPALLTTYDHPIFDEPDPFFGGQKVNRLFATDVAKIPPLVRTRDYNEAERYFDRSMNRWAAENQDNGAYLHAVAHALARSLGREVVPYETLARERPSS